MTKYLVNIGKKSHTIEIPEHLGSDENAIMQKGEIDGKPVSFRWQESTRSLFVQLETVNNALPCDRVYRMRRSAVRQFPGESEANIAFEYGAQGQSQMQILDATIARYSPATHSTKTAKQDTKPIIRSPITGKILKILVTEGQQVTTEDTLIIIEAMKMENKIFAKESGKIGKISAREGTLVNSGDELLRLELNK